MLRLLTVLFALLQLSSGLQLGGVRANVQLRRSASPLMGVSFKVGDTVEMITGDYKGESGKVIAVNKKGSKLTVEGINMQTKHVKPMKEGEQGRILKREAAVHMSNAKLTATAAAE